MFGKKRKLPFDDDEPDKAKPRQKSKRAQNKKPRWRLSWFGDDQPGDRPLAKPEIEYKKHLRLVRRVRIQSIIIGVLYVLLMLCYPVFKTSYIYYARQLGAPDGSEKRLVELDQPVLTRQAVLSWSMETVTEVLTYNFANYNERFFAMRPRFSDNGWVSFLKAIGVADVIQRFRDSQLVSTAAPSAPAEIQNEGVNPENGHYEWFVKVPITRKFVTNNDKSVISALTVRLILRRVPLTESPAGINIRVWYEN